MSSHWWWHPKSLTSTPSPTVGHQHTNELLYTFCGDYPLSLTMSANDRAGTILKWFLPQQWATHIWEGGQVTGRGESFIIPWLLHSSFISVCLALLVLKDRNRKGHGTFSHFLRYKALPKSDIQMCQCRYQWLDLDMWPPLAPLTSRLFWLSPTYTGAWTFSPSNALLLFYLFEFLNDLHCQEW